jgi:hypothetical protein
MSLATRLQSIAGKSLVSLAKLISAKGQARLGLGGITAAEALFTVAFPQERQRDTRVNVKKNRKIFIH